MALDDVRIGSGIVNKQISITISGKNSDVLLVSDQAGKAGKVFAFNLSSDKNARFIIRSGSEVIKEVCLNSDTTFSEQSSSCIWPLFQGLMHSDISVYQSDIATLNARAYAQYRWE